MTSEFKYSKGDVVRIVDKWSGFADPSEYEVRDSFLDTDPTYPGTLIKMYELKCVGINRYALIQESMLELIRSTIHTPTEAELADLFAHMDSQAREAAIDRLLEERTYLMFHRDLRSVGDAERFRMEQEIERIDEHLAKYSEGTDI